MKANKFLTTKFITTQLMMKKLLLVSMMLIISILLQAQPAKRMNPYDITKDTVLYTVGYAHLDSEWNWEYPTTINQYLRNTLIDNFRLFEKYPDYVFSFTGSRRYRLMKEYYPDLYEKMKGYIDQGRWFISGSSVDEGEVNVSSSESVMRQVLYGNQYFRKEFGKVSIDYMLPDCFGFTATLPSVWSHAGLKGFSTQKLSWGSANGVPFNVGIWEGPDGNGIISSLNATSYSGRVVNRLDRDSTWHKRMLSNINRYGLNFDFRYYGVGDVGGAPREEDVVNAIGSLNNSDSKFRVILTSTDQIYKDITPEIKSKLPVFSGDLLLTEHSAGSMTSQSFMKRANRKNEELARSAEQASVMAEWLGGSNYPFKKIADSWDLVLGSQFHDILPGTSTVRAYEYAWNDEFIAMNGFAEVLKNAVGNITRTMNTSVPGRAVVVYNPVASSREDVVTAKMHFVKMPSGIRVTDGNGNLMPSQVLSGTGNELTFIFVAKLPPAGLAVFSVDEANSSTLPTDLKVTDNSLENRYFRVKIDHNGDIAGIYDKTARRETLSKPSTLDFQEESPAQWPAWNMDWADRKNPPIGQMNKDVSVKIIENGPVRVAIQIMKKGQNSEIVQVISLSAGEAGKIVEVKNKIDWQSKAVSLKAAFPLTVVNEFATYGLNTAAVQRTTNNAVKFEVPGRKWIDLTDCSGSYGVSILEDCKYGSDKPDNSTLRLTLMYTPKANSYVYQGTQDWGIHEFKYGIYPHSGDWSYAGTTWKAQFLNNPPLAFEVPKHDGPAGKEFSFIKVNNNKVDLMAFKKAEEGDHYIIRINELTGKEANNVVLSFPGKVIDAYEVNGQEEKTGPVNFEGSNLTFNIGRFAIKSFAVKFGQPGGEVKKPSQLAVSLPYNADGFSFDTDRKDGNFTDGLTFPAEMISSGLTSEDIVFTTGNLQNGNNNVLIASGQKIRLPEGNFNKLYILAAATEDTKGDFKIGNRTVTMGIQGWTGFIGQHYSRKLYFNNLKVSSIAGAFTKRDNIAWFSSHRHSPDANNAYDYCYLYKYELDIPAGTKSITLPSNNRIGIIAMTIAENQKDDLIPLQLLYDDFKENQPVTPRIKEYVSVDMKPLTTQVPLFTSDIDPRLLPRIKQSLREAGQDTIVVKTLASSADCADINSNNNVTSYYYPSGKSSKGKMYSGEKNSLSNILSLNQASADTLFFDNGEGRILIDLQKPVSVERINMFFENPALRNTQGRSGSGSSRNPGQRMFSLWVAASNPEVTGDPKTKGWKYAAIYGGAGRNMGGSGVSFIFENTKEPVRYLMLVTEGGWHGTQYLNHVDVFDKE